MQNLHRVYRALELYKMGVIDLCDKVTLFLLFINVPKKKHTKQSKQQQTNTIWVYISFSRNIHLYTINTLYPNYLFCFLRLLGWGWSDWRIGYKLSVVYKCIFIEKLLCTQLLFVFCFCFYFVLCVGEGLGQNQI
jgi:hypothetical protein